MATPDSDSVPVVRNARLSLRGTLRRAGGWGWLLAALYAAAVAVLLIQGDLQGLAFGIGVALVAVGFAWAGLKLTEGRTVPLPALPRPGLGLLLWIPLNFLWLWGDVQRVYPYVDVGGREVGNVLFKLALLGVLPLILLRLKGDPAASWGFRPNLKADGKLLLVLAVPVVVVVGLYRLLGAYYFRAPTGEALAAFPGLLVYQFFRAGLPEEFFYRAYLQGHLVALLGSRVRGALLGGLIFGLLHILHWVLHGVGSLPQAYAYAMLNQVSIGLVFALLWERTRSLWPLALLHALVNATAFA